ncbi:MAG: SMP-30/gluconolactonase/LRE family protein [Acidobacteriia bacterium]|nr:SMP-30/gluconolactonase/LRE family protein [Terriglobia bacterium]
MTRAAGVSAAVVLACLALAQDFTKLTVEKIADGFRFTEGPAWSKEGFLVFSDTPTDRILKVVPGRRPEVLRDAANGPSGNAFDSQGRLYTCETRARRVVRADKGKIEAIAERWEGKRLNAPDDLVVARNGHVYFTDPAFGEQQDHRELDFYGVYHVSPKGAISLVARPVGRPNGIALSPNGRILYVSNSDEHNVRAYDLDHDGQASNERVLIAGIAGSPGGIAVDEKGELYVAANGVAIYTPEGRLLFVLDATQRVSNCAFGEADGKSLFLTERGGVYRARPEEPAAVAK